MKLPIKAGQRLAGDHSAVNFELSVGDRRGQGGSVGVGGTRGSGGDNPGPVPLSFSSVPPFQPNLCSGK